MKLLLDSHALVWAALGSPKLSRKARHSLETAESVFISAASAWEIATKVRLGRWEEARPVDVDFVTRLQTAGYELMPISVDVALRAGRMAGAHGDPFDRIIAAQALALDIPVISIDGSLDSFGVARIW